MVEHQPCLVTDTDLYGEINIDNSAIWICKIVPSPHSIHGSNVIEYVACHWHCSQGNGRFLKGSLEELEMQSLIGVVNVFLRIKRHQRAFSFFKEISCESTSRLEKEFSGLK